MEAVWAEVLRCHGPSGIPMFPEVMCDEGRLGREKAWTNLSLLSPSMEG
jgi:hypothetical protein